MNLQLIILGYSCNDRTMVASKTDDFAIEGSTLELNCIYIDDQIFKFEWEFPSDETVSKNWNYIESDTNEN